MKWFIHTASVLFVAAMLSGCGQESDQACAYDVQQNLNQQKWDDVISALGNGGTCNGYFTQQEALEYVGAAYLGKANVTASGLYKLYDDLKTALGVEDLGDANFTASNTIKIASKELDAFFGAKGESYFKAAADVYEQIVNLLNYTCEDSDLPTNVSFYCGVMETPSAVAQAKQGTTLVVSLGDDFDTFINSMSSETSYGPDDVNDNNKTDKQDVLICNLSDANKDVNESIGFGVCADITVTYEDKDNVTFVKSDHNFTYIHRIFNVEDVLGGHGNTTMERLVDRSTALASPATLDGTCGLDFNGKGCDLESNASCYPCPVVRDDGSSVTVAEGLLDVLNSSNNDLFASLLPEDANLTLSEDSNASNGLVEYIRREANLTGEGNLTAEELAAALELFSK